MWDSFLVELLGQKILHLKMWVGTTKVTSKRIYTDTIESAFPHALAEDGQSFQFLPVW